MIDLILITVLSLSTLFFLFLYAIQKKANKTIIAKTLETMLMQQLIKGPNKTDKEETSGLGIIIGGFVLGLFAGLIIAKQTRPQPIN